MTSSAPAPCSPIGDAAVDRAVRDIGAGRPVVVLDGSRGAGDLVLAAARADVSWTAFLVRHSSGFLCAPLAGRICDRLDLPPMPTDELRPGAAYTVAVDAAEGVTTGISAHDRAHTARLLADPDAAAADFTRPGHLVPVRAGDEGVLGHAGPAEAAVDLARLAGFAPAAVLGAVVGIEDPATLAGEAELRRFAATHDLAVVTIDELVAWRRATEIRVVRAAESRLPLAGADFRAVGFRAADGREHVALTLGEITGDGVPATVHTECVTGDVFGSVRCDCAARLRGALDRVAAEGRGVVVYLRGDDDCGVLRPCRDRHAVEDLLPAAHMLRELGVRSVRLQPGERAVAAALAAGGVAAEAAAPLGRAAHRAAEHRDRPFAAARAS